jgi:hypothetical protein
MTDDLIDITHFDGTTFRNRVGGPNLTPNEKERGRFGMSRRFAG